MPNPKKWNRCIKCHKKEKVHRKDAYSQTMCEVGTQTDKVKKSRATEMDDQHFMDGVRKMDIIRPVTTESSIDTLSISKIIIN